jgi:hypothetical protein
MKAIQVKNCEECPFRRYDNGGGFIEPFHICEKFNIILIDENCWTNLKKIHHDCRLNEHIK